MRCKQVEAQLADYTDDLLGARERARVEAHLAECEACRAAIGDMRAATEALRRLAPVRPPATFAPRIRSAVRAQAARALTPPLLRQDVRAALGGAFLLLAFGTLATHYLAQPRGYVATAPVATVAMGSLTAATEAPSRTVSGTAGRPEAREARPTARPSRTPHPRLGTDRSMSAMTGAPPSRGRLAPKSLAATGAERTPQGPLVSRPAARLAALPDSSAGPRLAEALSEAGPRLVALPAAEPPSATGPTTTLIATDGGRDAGVLTAASGTAEVETSLGFDELFNESSLPRYADVS